MTAMTCNAGQTGSGKTYTMGTGNPGQDDMSPEPHTISSHHLSHSWPDAVLTRSIEAVFHQVAARRLSGQWAINLAVSFSEVYMDKLYDLLEPANLEGMRRACRPDALRHPIVRDQDSLQVRHHSESVYTQGCQTRLLLGVAYQPYCMWI